MSHQTAGERWVAGTDGCAADWMVSFARLDEGEASAEVRLRVLPRFAAILCGGEPPAMIAVDIPIGSPAQAGRGGPAAENMVRPLLGERQSSAFSVPFATATQLTVLSCASNSDCAEFATRGNTKENREFSGGEQRSTSGLER
jgi:predicted RNase H-like nuclease